MGILDELYIRKKIRKILQEGEGEKEKEKTSGTGPKKIGVTVADLTARDGVYYMVHTLNGAVNAGNIDLGDWNVDVEKGGPGVLIVLKPSGSGQVKRGAVGRGGVSQAVKEAGALANENPAELMKRLGNPAAAGDTVPEKVLNLVRNSIYGNKTMVKAYGGASMLN
tara:strand:+ start:97 stop:594 length:498 start_codon:yes stop_codon:yes gene_type:complete